MTSPRLLRPPLSRPANAANAARARHRDELRRDRHRHRARHTLLANVIASSMDEHARYGGVVPEIAARAHLEALRARRSRAALAEAGVTLGELDAIAVTSGPGLAGALMVGVGAAKALALSHRQAPLRRQPPRRPRRRRRAARRRQRARAADDRAARLGRPHLAAARARPRRRRRTARRDDRRRRGRGVRQGGPAARPALPGRAADRPRRPSAATRRPSASRAGSPLPKDLAKHRYDFSFSGLKTAVARWVEQRRADGVEVPVADVAASFREAVADVLLTKALAACADRGVPRLLLGGGVVANARVRELAARTMRRGRCRAARAAPLALHRQRCDDRRSRRPARGARARRRRRSTSGPTRRCP